MEDLVTQPISPLQETLTAMGLLNTYAALFVGAFCVTLLLTPLVRRVAISAGVVDHPDRRKGHEHPVPYLGGLAVFAGVIVGISLSYFFHLEDTPASFAPVPIAVLIGMVAITFTGLADDLWGWDPRLKIAGQLVAAAALAINDVGVRVADGLLNPLMGNADAVLFTMGGVEIVNGQVFYWVGTAIIAIFVLGGCNAANFIDGLDGLLSGVAAIVAMGLLAISLLMVITMDPDALENGRSTLGGARIVLSLSLLGAVLGFLPHNFNPAAIFLGDCGSLLIGYLCVVVILMFGEFGQTHLVFAGLIIFSIPIIDTTLAILRRLLAGRPMSQADDQHMHHQLRRGLDSVKKAVLVLYALGALFATVGVTLAALLMYTELRVRIMYALALVLFSFVGVFAVKAARRQQLRIKLGPESAPTASPPDAPAQTTQGAAPLGKGPPVSP